MKGKDSKTSALSRQPGRFALVDQERPFVHRARKGKARGKLHALLVRALEKHREKRVIGLLLGKAKTQVPKSSFKKPTKREAQAEVADLLAILQRSAPEAARVVLKDGQLKADNPPPKEPADRRERLNPHSQAVLYPDSTVIRLYK